MAVGKYGPTTDYQTGTISDPCSHEVDVDLRSGTFSFVAQILIVPDGALFADEGDSGSLVFDTASRRAVGLVVGKSSRGFVVASPIAVALKLLGVTLVV